MKIGARANLFPGLKLSVYTKDPSMHAKWHKIYPSKNQSPSTHSLALKSGVEELNYPMTLNAFDDVQVTNFVFMAFM